MRRAEEETRLARALAEEEAAKIAAEAAAEGGELSSRDADLARQQKLLRNDGPFGPSRYLKASPIGGARRRSVRFSPMGQLRAPLGGVARPSLSTRRTAKPKAVQPIPAPRSPTPAAAAVRSPGAVRSAATRPAGSQQAGARQTGAKLPALKPTVKAALKPPGRQRVSLF